MKELLIQLSDFSLEQVVISLLVFLVTMLIKWPIKKATSKFDENKRKAVNTVIVFIPIILSIALCFASDVIFGRTLQPQLLLQNSLNTYVIAVAIYGTFTRLVAIIKSLQNGTKPSKETTTYIKKNLKTISKALKIDEKNLESVASKIEELLCIRNELCANSQLQEIGAIESIDKQISSLEEEENALKNSIGENQKQMSAYKTTQK